MRTLKAVGKTILLGLLSITIAIKASIALPIKANEYATKQTYLPHTSNESNNETLIDMSRVYQEFEGWGTSLCWWANALGRWEGPKKQEVLKLLFDEEEGLGLNIVRYNIGGGINPDELKNMRTYADIPSFQPEPGQ